MFYQFKFYFASGRSHASSISSSADSRFQFPEVSIHNQLSEALARIESESDLNSESDLDETPRASPQPETVNADSGLAEYSFSEEFSQTREAQDEAVTFDTAMTTPLLDNEKYMRIGKYIEDQREFSGEHRKLVDRESKMNRKSDEINVKTFIERDSGIENKLDVNSANIDIHGTNVKQSYDNENTSLIKNLCKNEDAARHDMLTAMSTPIAPRNDELHKHTNCKIQPLTFNKKTTASNSSSREQPHHHVQYINKNVQNLIQSSGVGGDITPQSESSGPRSVSSVVFADSPIRFYSFAPSSTDDNRHNMSRNNGNFQFTYGHRHRKELCGLVESCFEKKITTEGIKAIIFSRRKTDRVAKRYGMT